MRFAAVVRALLCQGLATHKPCPPRALVQFCSMGQGLAPAEHGRDELAALQAMLHDMGPEAARERGASSGGGRNAAREQRSGEHAEHRRCAGAMWSRTSWTKSRTSGAHSIPQLPLHAKHQQGQLQPPQR